MRPVDVLASVTHHSREPLVVQVAHQEAEQVAGRGVGPVEILQDDQRRPLGRQQPDHRHQLLEEASPRCRAGLGRFVARPGELGDEPCELQADRLGGCLEQLGRGSAQRHAQGGDDRRERQLALAQRHAFPPQREKSSIAGPASELPQQARLADARVAGDQGQRGPAALGHSERLLEERQLILAAHDRRTGDPALHRSIFASGECPEGLRASRDGTCRSGGRPPRGDHALE